MLILNIIKRFRNVLLYVCTFCLLSSGCSSGSNEQILPEENVEEETPVPDLEEDLSTNSVSRNCLVVEKELRRKLDKSSSSEENIESAEGFTFKISTFDGREFFHSVGESSVNDQDGLASATKWISTVVILRLVDQGYLTLDTKPQDVISGWPIPETDPLYNITLRHLLSMTSGLDIGVDCIYSENVTIEECVLSIAEVNIGKNISPGEQYFYVANHLHVAGFMAMQATGKTWHEIFEEFKAETGIIPSGTYDLGNTENPVIASGLSIVWDDYMQFIRSFSNDSLLSEELMSETLSDQIELLGAEIEFSPISLINEEWHFGLGIFHECNDSSFDECEPSMRVSCPGLFGYYPYLDLEREYFGMVAQSAPDSGVGTGILIERIVRPLVHDWLVCFDP